jgi:AcrR family transcriptional regulator
MSGSKGRAGNTDRGVRLDAEKIVSAALLVVEEHGLSGTTMRMVGAALGSDHTAVYRYFASKDELIAAIADRLFGEILQTPLTGTWRERLTQIATAGRTVYRSHPTIVDVLANQREDTPSLQAVNEIVVSCLREAGLDPSEVGLFHQVLVSYAIGTGLHEAAWGKLGDGARRMSRRYYAALDADEFPNITAVAGHLFPDEDEVFVFASDLLFDAIERAGQRNRRTRRATT